MRGARNKRGPHLSLANTLGSGTNYLQVVKALNVHKSGRCPIAIHSHCFVTKSQKYCLAIAAFSIVGVRVTFDIHKKQIANYVHKSSIFDKGWLICGNYPH